jgi:hypothetical protein
MKNDKGEDNMAVKQEELKNAEAKIARKRLILELTRKACEENDAGLKRLSKN